MYNNRGITMIMLVIAVVIMSVLIGVSIKIVSDIVKKNELENIKDNMSTIQTKAMQIAEKATFETNNSEEAEDSDEKAYSKETEEEEEIKKEQGTKLVGIKLNAENGYEAEGYAISQSLKAAIGHLEECYLWNEEDLKNNGLSDIKIDNKKFYIVDYNNDCEVYYSLGIMGEHALTRIKDL